MRVAGSYVVHVDSAAWRRKFGAITSSDRYLISDVQIHLTEVINNYLADIGVAAEPDRG